MTFEGCFSCTQSPCCHTESVPCAFTPLILQSCDSFSNASLPVFLVTLCLSVSLRLLRSRVCLTRLPTQRYSLAPNRTRFLLWDCLLCGWMLVPTSLQPVQGTSAVISPFVLPKDGSWLISLEPARSLLYLIQFMFEPFCANLHVSQVFYPRNEFLSCWDITKPRTTQVTSYFSRRHISTSYCHTLRNYLNVGCNGV